ncbi:MAG: hypothetical protein KDB22_13965 [Planctomycetales bacterium]|nr:hypothetical protein [Planctomycetales bacterium]
MVEFNKVFMIGLPRCATVSTSDALGMLGIRTAHLGRIYGEHSVEHNNPKRLTRIYDQIAAGDFDLDILRECDGLADYPACSFQVLQQLDQHYPGSLFINVRRDQEIDRWLQSVERQFIGLQLIKQGKTASDEEKNFMKVMLAFREMTFGQSRFDADAYRSAYLDYQAAIDTHFMNRGAHLLQVDIQTLESHGLELLADFLDCRDQLEIGNRFPNSNHHSKRPSEAFMLALDEGRIQSQTGIVAVRC